MLKLTIFEMREIYFLRMGKPKNAQPRGASLPNEMSADVDKRLETLKPWVGNFSAYVQRLIYLDLTYGILDKEGGVNDAVVNKSKGKRPFNFAIPTLSNAL